jgi:hypothetical protein
MRYLRGHCIFVTRRGYLGLGLASPALVGDSVSHVGGRFSPILAA